MIVFWPLAGLALLFGPARLNPAAGLALVLMPLVWWHIELATRKITCFRIDRAGIHIQPPGKHIPAEEIAAIRCGRAIGPTAVAIDPGLTRLRFCMLFGRCDFPGTSGRLWVRRDQGGTRVT